MYGAAKESVNEKTGLLSNQTKQQTLSSINVEMLIPLLFPATVPLFTIPLGKSTLSGQVVSTRVVPYSNRSAAKWILVK